MIRAVKYAAMTGFSMPSGLSRNIKKHAHLLSGISPSRITEELVKIVNCGSARGIAELALRHGIYPYLQPSACALILGDAEFKKAYFESLGELDALVRNSSVSSGDAPASPVRFGEKLSYFLRDSVRRAADWEKEAKRTPHGDLFVMAWTHCRNFILPMNPQRTELDFAVRHLLKQFGLKGGSVKRPRGRMSGDRPPGRRGISGGRSSSLGQPDERTGDERQD
jgi:poly(A) polymerase